ncbi:MAG: ATP-grasp domain-containing protein [Polyangiaceae bacterium]|nr:ATP-grasp domain-containing protein [Polyangiaceae bacterium]
MRVLLLTQEVGPDSPPDERDVLVETEFVAGALARLGHRVDRDTVSLDLRRLRRRLAQDRPELVFNLVESLDGEDELQPLVPALLEALAIPFTGSGSAVLAVTGDKPRAKERLAAHGIPTPSWRWRGTSLGAFAEGRYIMKPARREASQGIDDRAVIEVRSAAELDARLRARSDALGVECFAERYVDGREASVTLLARAGTLAVLGVAEIEFSAYPPQKPRIVGYEAKWRAGSFEFEHTPRRFWSETAEGERYARVARLALESATVLGVTGFARVDLRLDGTESPWVLEVNANPCLSPDAGFFAAAAQAGLDDGGICAAIVEDATRDGNVTSTGCRGG